MGEAGIPLSHPATNHQKRNEHEESRRVTIYLAEPYKRSKNPNRMRKPEVVRASYQPDYRDGDGTAFQVLVDMHPEVIYYSDDPDADFGPWGDTPTDVTFHVEGQEIRVHVLRNGTLDVRSNHGTLLVRPVMSNRIEISVED